MNGVLGVTGISVSPGVAVAVAVLFGLLCLISASRFQRRTGVGPWRIHPAAWLVIGLLIGIFGLLLCLIAQRWGTRPRDPGCWAPGAAHAPGQVRADAQGWASNVPGRPPPNWYPDPSANFAMRYWNGAAWTEHVVARDGTQSIDQPTATPKEPGADLG
jgi:hypothetical protein